MSSKHIMRWILLCSKTVSDWNWIGIETPHLKGHHTAFFTITPLIAGCVQPIRDCKGRGKVKYFIKEGDIVAYKVWSRKTYQNHEERLFHVPELPYYYMVMIEFDMYTNISFIIDVLLIYANIYVA